MTINPIEVEKTLYIYVENSACKIVRTGLLGYYDPLPITDLFPMTIAELNMIKDILPSSSDTGLDNFPYAINAHKFNLIINQ